MNIKTISSNLEEDIFAPPPTIPVHKDKYNFVTLSQEVPKFCFFNTTLSNVLNGEGDISKVKNIIMGIESKLDDRDNFCNRNKLYAFHETILDLKEKLSPMIMYVKSLPKQLDSKHSKQLKGLRLACKDTEQTMVACYHTQNKLEKILIEQRDKKSNKQQSLADTLFGHGDGDKLCSSGITDEQDEKDRKFRNRFIDTISKTYTATDKNILLPNSATRTGLDKLFEDDKFRE